MYFMLPRPSNGRTNIGTVSLDANELKFCVRRFPYYHHVDGRTDGSGGKSQLASGTRRPVCIDCTCLCADADNP